MGWTLPRLYATVAIAMALTDRRVLHRIPHPGVAGLGLIPKAAPKPSTPLFMHHKNGMALILSVALAAVTDAADLRLGMIGMDTGHSINFTELLNNPAAKDHIPGARVVAAFKVSSPDIQSSWSRVDANAEKLRKDFGVKFYESIEEMLKHVDCVLMEDNDARRHVSLARKVLAAGKRLYIEKPMTLSAKDAIELFALAKKHQGAGVMSSSGARFGQEMQEVRNGKIGKVLRAEMYGAVNLEPTNPELFWYGVHGVESLFTVFGPGIETVTRLSSAKGAIVTEGRWADGRIGIFREGNRNSGKAVGDKGESTTVGRWDGYRPLVLAIMSFFQTGVSPVPERETIEIMAFMEADIMSKARGGQPVKIAELLK
jgi:hypothetical protein